MSIVICMECCGNRSSSNHILFDSSVTFPVTWHDKINFFSDFKLQFFVAKDEILILFSPVFDISLLFHFSFPYFCIIIKNLL